MPLCQLVYIVSIYSICSCNCFISLFLLSLLSNSIPIVRPNDSNSSFDIDEKSGFGGSTGSSTDAGAVSETEAELSNEVDENESIHYDNEGNIIDLDELESE